MTAHVPYNRPHLTGDELFYIEQAIENGHLSGNGPFGQRCAKWLTAHTEPIARSSPRPLRAPDGGDPG